MVFYGWWVVLSASLAWAASGPGHSFGINEFVDSFILELNATRTSISVVWVSASWVSALFVPCAGAMLDKCGSRRLLLLVTVPYVVTIALMRYATSSLAVLCALVAGMRLLGPECLTLVSQTSVSLWFTRNRGRAQAVVGLVRVFFFMEPVLFAWMISEFEWRGAYGVIAIAAGCLLVAALLLMRDSPEKMGLLPDGDDGAVAYKRVLDLSMADGSGSLAGGGANGEEEEQEIDTVNGDDEATLEGGREEDCRGGSGGGGVKKKKEAYSAVVPIECSKRSTEGTSSVNDDTEESLAGAKNDEGGSININIDGNLPTNNTDLRPSAEGTVDEADGADFKWVLRQRVFWQATLCSAVGGFYWGGMNYHINDHVHLVSGLSAVEAAAAIYAPLAVVSNVVSTLLGLFVVDKLSTRTLVRAWAAR